MPVGVRVRVRFKAVNQYFLQKQTDEAGKPRNCGPWGEDAEDFMLGKNWHTADELRKKLPLDEAGYDEDLKKPVVYWYDLHAKRV